MLDNNKDKEEKMINSPDEESPKIEPINKNEIFIDIPIRTTNNEIKGSASADLVSIQGSNGMVNDTCEIIVINDLDEKANRLIKCFFEEIVIFEQFRIIKRCCSNKFDIYYQIDNRIGQ